MQTQTNRKMVTIAMLVAVLLVAIDVTVVSTAMPKIVSDLHGLSLYSWVFAIYTLTTCVTTPIYGKLSDLFGRKIVFMIGVVLFLVGSVLSGAAQSMAQLVWFRAFQGIGAGAVMPVTFTIIGDLFPGEQRARMQGVFSSVWGVAGLLGPLMGGLFVDHLSWRWIFYINLPVGIIAIVLVSLFLHEHVQKKTKHIDYWGALTFTVALSSLLYALLNGGQKYAWSSLTIVSLLIAFVLFTALFLVVESKAQEPMLPLSLFAMPVIAISNLMMFLMSFVLMGSNVYLPMWIQSILGHSATSSGLTLMPMSIAWPLGSTLAGRYMYRLGSKATAVFGAVTVLAGASWLVVVHLDSPYWYFVGLMIVLGFGMGYATTPTSVLVQSAVGWQMRGAATGSNTLMRSLGQTVGVTIFGTVFNHAITSYLGTNFPTGREASLLMGIIAAGSTTGSAAKTLPANVLHDVQRTLATGLHSVFVVTIIVAALGLLASFILPAHRKVLAQQAQVNR